MPDHFNRLLLASVLSVSSVYSTELMAATGTVGVTAATVTPGTEITLHDLPKPNPLGRHYVLYKPATLDPATQALPLIVFLHGAGASESPAAVSHAGLMGWAAIHHPQVLIVAPVNPIRRVWWSPSFVNDVISDIERRFSIDPQRIILTGTSMGGFGSWSTAMAYPNRFAAVVPVAGALPNDILAYHYPAPLTAESEWLPQMSALIGLPVLAIHGDSDALVPLSLGQRALDVLRAAGNTSHQMQVIKADHAQTLTGAWSFQLISWMLQQRQPAPSSLPRPMPQATLYEGEFSGAYNTRVRLQRHSAGTLFARWSGPAPLMEIMPYAGGHHFSGAYNARFYGLHEGRMHCLTFAPKSPLTTMRRLGSSVDCNKAE